MEELESADAHLIDTDRGRFCVRKHEGEWIAHSAECAHQLGPLENAVIAEDGSITCPWHGYRFCVKTGKNLDGKCASLATAPAVEEKDGLLYLVFDG